MLMAASAVPGALASISRANVCIAKAMTSTGIHLNSAARLSEWARPPHAATAVARTVSSTCINSSSSAVLNKPSGP